MREGGDMEKSKPIVAFSTGDLNGIGLEIILKTLQIHGYLEFFTPVIFASGKVVSYHRKVINSNVQLNNINSLKDIKHNAINVMECWKEEVRIELGKPTDDSGKYALQSLVAAAEAVKNNEAQVLVTAPVDKANIAIHEAGFKGHTQYLEKLWGGKSMMVLLNDNLRVALYTHHIPLREVPDALDANNLQQSIKDLNQVLIKDFGINKPRIAVLGLNPHAGDHGVIGKEEEEIINPVIQKMFDIEGVLVFGSYPADSFFQPDMMSCFDGVLGLYHDQALVGFKTLAFHEGVNYTAGLPFVRTSPDHGTAFDIAGKGVAQHDSLTHAIFEGIRIYEHRNEYSLLTANPLRPQKQKMRRKAGDVEE